ncbi:hypothetical protein [Kosmotoga pacifica]|nr:hypothetical protein [Kosmotoga pacifica]
MGIYDRDWYREEKEKKPPLKKRRTDKSFMTGLIIGFVLGVVLTLLITLF